MDEIQTKCAQVLAKVLGVDLATINDNTSPDNLDQWDSLAHVQLILELEKAFAIKIPPDEGIDIESFKMMCALIDNKLNAVAEG